MDQITLTQVFHYMSGFVFICSILGSLLPPFEWFEPWPRFQAIYKVFTMLLSRWGSLNIKSIIYPQIGATSNASGTPIPTSTGGTKK